MQSIERCFQILEYIADHPGARLREITAATGLTTPTAHRFLAVLAELGYLGKTMSGYSVTMRLTALSRGLATSPREAATALLQAIADESGLTAYLAAQYGDEMVYLLRATPDGLPLGNPQRIGHRAPLYCTGVGKALLARETDADCQAYLERTELAPLTEHTITESAVMAERLALIRQQGFARDEQECEVGLACTAIALPGTRVAISLSGPAELASLATAPAHARLLNSIAAQLVAMGSPAWS